MFNKIVAALCVFVLTGNILVGIICAEEVQTEKNAAAPECPLEHGVWEFYPAMSDEFNDETLDKTKWHPNNPTWLGRQPGYFSKDNVTVKDGSLQLSARAEDLPEVPEGYHTFTTAAVKSVERVLYGYFEIRAKPMNSAASSAFWFYAQDPEWWTEIDVFEICGKGKNLDRRYFMNLHVFKTPQRGENHTEDQAIWDAPFRFAEDFHIYALEWNKDELKFYVDGKLLRTSKNTEWHQPLHLNFDSETMPEWFGLPEKDDLPSTFYIDYVRCWKEKE